MSQTYTDLTETMFPDSMDQWDRYLDPTIQTISLITQYQNFYNQGKFEEANGVIEHNPILKRIIVNASMMNKTLDAIMTRSGFISAISRRICKILSSSRASTLPL